jgi:hypothetical protein
MRKLVLVSSICFAVSYVGVARAQDAPQPPPPPESPEMVGVGYKMGKGIGFLGADVIFSPVPHFGIDIHAAWIDGFDSAYALAPALQGYLKPRGSTPYAAVGLQYVHATLGDATASGTGFFANVGYEWKWPSGLGLIVGGGVQYLEEVTATDGATTVTTGGGFNPNLEFGVRYRFL